MHKLCTKNANCQYNIKKKFINETNYLYFLSLGLLVTGPILLRSLAFWLILLL